MTRTVERRWEIYGLVDPRNGFIRYVGVTHRAKARLLEHVSKAVNRGKTHRERWIVSLAQGGYQPAHELIEAGYGAGWGERESFWIAYYRQYYDLVNTTDGGEGLLGYRPTKELRETWSRQRRGVKYAVGRRPGMLGKKHSDEARRKISEAQRRRGPMSEAVRRKIGDKNRGLVRSAELRAHLSAIRMGRPQTEEHRKKICDATAKLGRPVVCVETGATWPSIKAAARAFCTTPSSITQSIRKGCRAAGFHWARCDRATPGGGPQSGGA